MVILVTDGECAGYLKSQYFQSEVCHSGSLGVAVGLRPRGHEFSSSSCRLLCVDGLLLEANGLFDRQKVTMQPVALHE